MSTYDLVDKSTGADYYGEGTCFASTNPSFMWRRRVDLAASGDTFTTTGAFGAGDILQLFNVSEGHKITDVVVHVITAEGATLAVTVGDGDDPDGFIVAGDLNSADSWQSGSIQTTYAGDYIDGTTYHGGKIYTASDTIDMVLTTASADVAVFDIFVIGFDLSKTNGLL